MKEINRVIDNITLLLWCVAIVGLGWQTLEMIYYGAVQPRAVDNIIGLIWLGSVVIAYKRGFREGKKSDAQL